MLQNAVIFLITVAHCDKILPCSGITHIMALYSIMKISYQNTRRLLGLGLQSDIKVNLILQSNSIINNYHVTN